jgi:hypothetical protein
MDAVHRWTKVARNNLVKQAPILVWLGGHIFEDKRHCKGFLGAFIKGRGAKIHSSKKCISDSC